MGLDDTTALKLGKASEEPDTYVNDDGSMEERTTWAKAKEQQRFHALTGGYHGVELAATIYAILKTHNAEDFDSYLLHRFGDDFAHFHIKDDLNGLTPISVQAYADTFERCINTFIDKNISIVSVAPPDNAANTWKSHCGSYYFVKNNSKLLATLTKEAIHKSFTDFILAGMHGSTFIKFPPILKQDNFSKVLAAAKRVLPDLNTENMPDGVIAEMFSLIKMRGVKMQQLGIPENDNVIDFSKYFYEYKSYLTWSDAQKYVLHSLPNATQNSNVMYGETQICGRTFGHADVGANILKHIGISITDNSGDADEILRRQPLFLLYTDMLTQLLSIKYNVSTDKRDLVNTTMSALMATLAKLGKESRLDAILAFEFAKRNNPSAEVIVIEIPIKYFEMGDDFKGLGLNGYYKEISEVSTGDEKIHLLKKQAQSIKQVFETYMENTNTGYSIAKIDESNEQKITIYLKTN
jgi:hypothetical protein